MAEVISAEAITSEVTMEEVIIPDINLSNGPTTATSISLARLITRLMSDSQQFLLPHSQQSLLPQQRPQQFF